MNSVHGIIPPLPTPFDESGEIDENLLRDHVEFLLTAGVHGVFPGSSLGEVSSLNTDELTRVIRIVVDQVDGRVPVFAGTGASGTKETIRRSELAIEAGADFLIVVTPYFLSPSEGGFRQHYADVANTSSVPILLYHVPGLSGQSLSAETVIEIANNNDNIIGIKDSGGDLIWGSQIIKGTAEDFIYLQGYGGLLLPSLVVGADGGVTGTANIAPKLLLDVFEAYQNEQMERARKLQIEKVTPLAEELMCETFPAGFKIAGELTGRDLGVPRSPVSGVPDADAESIRSTLHSLGLCNKPSQ